MHLWDFQRAGMQIWEFWMLKMSDSSNNSESYSSDQDNKVETCLLKQSISLLSRPTTIWTENWPGRLEPKLNLCLLAGFLLLETAFHITISSWKFFISDFTHRYMFVYSVKHLQYLQLYQWRCRCLGGRRFHWGTHRGREARWECCSLGRSQLLGFPPLYNFK